MFLGSFNKLFHSIASIQPRFYFFDDSLVPSFLIFLTRIFFCGGAEENAESGLEVGRFARGVSPAELDAVGQHEGARSRVEHVVGGGVDVARDELEVRVLL